MVLAIGIYLKVLKLQKWLGIPTHYIVLRFSDSILVAVKFNLTSSYPQLPQQ